MTLPLKYLLKSDSVFSGSLLYVFYQEAWDFARGLFSEGCSRVGTKMENVLKLENIY